MSASPTAMSGSAEVAAKVQSALRAAFGRDLRAIVLTGSLARNEGTWSERNGRLRLLGDAEFLAVFRERAPLPSEERVTQLECDIQTQLFTEAVDAAIGLSPVRPSNLKTLAPHMFAYELREHGQVIWGEDEILEVIPRFAAGDIPFEDAFRTLLNRLIELLEVVCDAECMEPLAETVRYRAAKMLLDMASSFLIFQGKYESSYRARAARLAQIAAAGIAVTPIPLKQFSDRVQLATKYKLGDPTCAPIRSLKGLLDLTSEVHSLWSWELERLTGLSRYPRDGELLQRWLQSQPLIARMRGWAALVKRYGLWKGARMLPRWLRLAVKGSPRRLIYAAATEFYFDLPAALSENGRGISEREVTMARASAMLPVVSGHEDISWQIIGRAIASNYHQFLESTRS